MSQQLYGKEYAGSAPHNYERYFVPAIGAPVANELIAMAALRPRERVLDVACGTGVVSRIASERVGNEGIVAGLDVNRGMLTVASSTTPSGMSIEWHEASAEAMPLPDASFDVVLCQMGLQFMADYIATTCFPSRRQLEFRALPWWPCRWRQLGFPWSAIRRGWATIRIPAFW